MFKNIYNTLHSCHNFPAGLWQAAKAARICEMGLFTDAYTTLGGNELIFHK